MAYSREIDCKRVGNAYSEFITHSDMDAEASSGSDTDSFEDGPEDCEGCKDVTVEIWNDHASVDSTHKIFTGPTKDGPWEQKPDTSTSYDVTHGSAPKTVQLDGPISWLKIMSIAQTDTAISEGINAKVTKRY